MIWWTTPISRKRITYQTEHVGTYKLKGWLCRVSMLLLAVTCLLCMTVQLPYKSMRQNSTVCVMTRLQTGQARNLFQFLAGERFFFSLKCPEQYSLYCLWNIFKVIKSWRTRQAGHVAFMGKTRKACIVLVVKSEGKRPLGDLSIDQMVI